MADHAIIRTGGKQYVVEPGKTYTFEKLPGNAGSEVVFDEVLLTFGDEGKEIQIGTPIVSGTPVHGEIVEQSRTRKLIVVKYKAKARYRRKQGHRQYQTKVKISSIGQPTGRPIVAEQVAEEPAVEAPKEAAQE
ncbi:MAG: 50S ribosomal protein L21 [Candidatus Uhrbacteria bacterium]